MGCQICRRLLLENAIAVCISFTTKNFSQHQLNYFINFSLFDKNLAIIDMQPIPTHFLDELKTRRPRTQIMYFQCDISLEDRLSSTFDEIARIFQKIDILINAAGIFNDIDVELTFKVNVVRASMSSCQFSLILLLSL